MALALTDFSTRISRELKLLAVPTAAVTDQIKDGLTELMLAIKDSCRIKAMLAVSSATNTYSLPKTIDKIEAIEDDAGAAVVYSVDELENKLTLQTSESSATAVIYKVYGTPANVRTNASTIIAALPESYAVALWAFIVAACHEYANTDQLATRQATARRKAHELLMYLNTSAGYRDRTIAIIDVRGQRVGDSSASDAIDVDIDDFGETEGYDPT